MKFNLNKEQVAIIKGMCSTASVVEVIAEPGYMDLLVDTGEIFKTTRVPIDSDNHIIFSIASRLLRSVLSVTNYEIRVNKENIDIIAYDPENSTPKSMVRLERRMHLNKNTGYLLSMTDRIRNEENLNSYSKIDIKLISDLAKSVDSGVSMKDGIASMAGEGIYCFISRDIPEDTEATLTKEGIKVLADTLSLKHVRYKIEESYIVFMISEEYMVGIRKARTQHTIGPEVLNEHALMALAEVPIKDLIAAIESMPPKSEQLGTKFNINLKLGYIGVGSEVNGYLTLASDMVVSLDKTPGTVSLDIDLLTKLKSVLKVKTGATKVKLQVYTRFTAIVFDSVITVITSKMEERKRRD